MNSISSVILQATSCLCERWGCMPLQQLQQELQQRCRMTNEDFIYIIQNCPQRFLLVPDGESYSVVGRTSLRLCGPYSRGARCGGNCQQLHLCRFYVFGNCRFGKGRKLCNLSHDVSSRHNAGLLRECTLQQLQEDQLFLLLLQNDPQLLPEVCVHYNKGSAPHGSCRFQDSCSKLHLCQHFLQGVCRFGPRCRRQHAVDHSSQSVLEQRGLSRQLIRDLPAIYRNAHHLNAAAASAAAPSPAAASPAAASPAAAADDSDSGQFCKAAQTDEMEEICLHFIRSSCKFRDSCRQVHFHLPYKWEVYDGRCWSALENMEEIERDYCDPAKTHSSDYQRVDFVTMTMESMPIRRLSTVSWVRRPPHYSLTTQWLWYCQAERGGWLEYGQPDEKQRTTSVVSRTLEEAFISGETEVQVEKGQRVYVVSFRDMYQRNPKHHTKRRVRRRPRFVSKAEVDKLAADLRKCSG
ncbi:protein mono-ADP-ribosyltransferase PARP12b isoform X2 [Poeciliopsis prolifica]|uniref:protein mono-ADP-ribosyltransferase PARP12b isoform X2 n=1 Tax=Poeciliopsis prolifica TaxID=188132 RepID=UPI002413D375|nr:protein mono-ADP-ribosyltransferase PARP12b isoform X2 [Poeciliopsis prolifica]